MQGLDGVHSLTKDTIEKLLRTIYSKSIYDLNQIEDIVLFTEGRKEYPNIGTDVIKLHTMTYILENIYWINVCLFVNEDFRSCFDDAIMIEKALLQVNDQEYQDFRDDMTLDDPNQKGPVRNVVINLSNHTDKMEMALFARIEDAKQKFFNAGMTDVYEDLLNTFEKRTELEVSYTIHNLVYVINAMNRNGVFHKYVRLVVDSVKEQLS